MTILLEMHPVTPQLRAVKQVVTALEKASVVVLPTDTGYSLCCKPGEKAPLQQICRIRQLEPQHFFTLLCCDFTVISYYARLDNTAFRFLKAHMPAPLTAILPATKALPKHLLQPKRRTIGVRIPQNPILLSVLQAMGMPLASVSVDEFPESWPLLDPQVISTRYEGMVAQVVDGGVVTASHTTIVDLTTDVPQIVRQGACEIQC